MVEQDWERLARLVVAARDARGMSTREQLATAGDFSTRFLGDIEKARRDNYDPVYLARLERALGWATGSVDAILRGGDPVDAAVAQRAQSAEDDLDQDIEFEIRMIQASDLPERQKSELIKYAKELQRRQRAEREALRDRQATDRRNQIRTIMDIARGDRPQAAT